MDICSCLYTDGQNRWQRPEASFPMQMWAKYNVYDSAETKHVPVFSALRIKWTGLERWLRGRDLAGQTGGPEFESAKPFKQEHTRDTAGVSRATAVRCQAETGSLETLRQASFMYAVVMTLFQTQEKERMSDTQDYPLPSTWAPTLAYMSMHTHAHVHLQAHTQTHTRMPKCIHMCTYTHTCVVK